MTSSSPTWTIYNISKSQSMPVICRMLADWPCLPFPTNLWYQLTSHRYPGPTIRALELLQVERFRKDILIPEKWHSLWTEGVKASTIDRWKDLREILIVWEKSILESYWEFDSASRTIHGTAVPHIESKEVEVEWHASDVWDWLLGYCWLNGFATLKGGVRICENILD